jgi:hypothetical protein
MGPLEYKDSFYYPGQHKSLINAISYIWKPYLRSGKKNTLLITCSDFGVSLMETFHGTEAALQLVGALPQEYRVGDFLQKFAFTHRWQ